MSTPKPKPKNPGVRQEGCSEFGLTSYPVMGYDGRQGSLFMLFGGGDAIAEDGWKVTFASNPGGSGLYAYVKNAEGVHVGTYALRGEDFAAEALRLARAKVAARQESRA